MTAKQHAIEISACEFGEIDFSIFRALLQSLGECPNLSDKPLCVRADRQDAATLLGVDPGVGT